MNRLRGTPKDTIPIVGKTPRKQRSSRFYVTEKVDIEKLPNFMGMSVLAFLETSLERRRYSNGCLLDERECQWP